MTLTRSIITAESYVVTCPFCEEPIPSKDGALNWTSDEIDAAMIVCSVAMNHRGDIAPILGAVKCACGNWSKVDNRRVLL